jgi:long-chain acyl-CoA synthetase
MLIGELARLNAARYGNKIAFRDANRSITFDQANARINALIRSLRELGLQKGDRVAVLLYNCAIYCELLFGIPKGGFILVPINYRLVGRELTYILNDSESSALIFDPELAETIENIKPDLETVKHFICVGDERDDNGDLSYEKLVTGKVSDEISADVQESDIAFILYTSGTTGFPKGAMLTHKNIFTNICNAALVRAVKPDDKLFNIPPLYHCAAQTEMFVWAMYGCQTYSIKQFDTLGVLEALRIERPNIVMMVPTMINMVINHPNIEDYDFSFVDLMIYGGSSIRRNHLEKAMNVFGCKFLQTAGMTEASPCLMFLLPEDHILEGPDHMVKRLGAGGREGKLTEIKIVDENGNECPSGLPGEAVARGDHIMLGYWKKPEETANTIRDGWLHTGDICIKDEDGYIYYVDRIKDMICRGGENVYPREIEEVIATHSKVLEVAVIGVPDSRLEEEIMAVVELKEGETIEEREIVDICRGSLAGYKRPRYVAYIDHMPKTSSGKILKRDLKAHYRHAPLPDKVI